MFDYVLVPLLLYRMTGNETGRLKNPGKKGTCKNINLITNHCKQFTISLTALVSNNKQVSAPPIKRMRHQHHLQFALDIK